MGRDLHYLPLDEEPKDKKEVYESEHWVDDRNKIWTYGISRYNDYIESDEYLTRDQIVERIDELWQKLKAEHNSKGVGPSKSEEDEEIADDKRFWRIGELSEAISTYAYILHECSAGVYILYH